MSARPEQTPADEDLAAAGVLETLRGVPGTVRLLLIGVFVNQLGGFLQAFLVLYLVHRGFSGAQGGVALTVYGVGCVLGTVFGGGFADRIGPRATIAGSLLASGLLVAAISTLTQYPVILAAVFLAGAVTQSYRPAASGLILGGTPKARRTMIMAVYRAAVNLGATGGPLLAAWLIALSWNLVFWVDGATSVAYGAIAVLALPRAGRPAERSGDDARPAGPKSGLGYGPVLRDSRYRAYLLMVFVNAVIYIQMMAVLPLSVRRAGHGPLVYSSLFSLSAGIIICCELLITKVIQSWPPRIAVSAGFLLLGSGLVGFGLPGGVPVLLVAMLLATLGEMVGGPSVFAWPSRVAPAEGTGRYLGAMQAMFGLGQAVGPVAGVAVWNAAGGQVWGWCGVGAALCVAFAWLGMREPAPEPSRPAAAENEAVAA